jgi:4-carboxymuconolactone decarboxylase
VSRPPYPRRDELTPGGQEVWDSIVGSRGAALVTDQGALTGPFNAFVHAPDVGRHLTSLGQVLRFETSIERRLSELAIITVGARWKAELPSPFRCRREPPRCGTSRTADRVQQLTTIC